jgi:sodium-dependent phosphate cotransporter
MTPEKSNDADEEQNQETYNNGSDSLVFVSLNDHRDGDNDKDYNAIDTNELQGEGPSLSSIDYSTPPPNAGHRRNSSRIGRIYRTTTDKGIHIAAASSEHGTVNIRNPSSVNKTLDDVHEEDAEADATWKEVFIACCCHTAKGWIYVGVVIVVLLLLLYFFMFGLDMLSASFQVVSGCSAGSLLGSDTNPLASVLIGIVATALLQSSSTTTSIVVAMCGSGLDVQAGIYIVMGANIGTSVTSMLVSLTHMGDGEELERAFAGSSLYYLFNILTAVILLPLEVGTQYLYRLTRAMLPGEGIDNMNQQAWNSPIKAIVSPLTTRIIIANKALVTDISTGEAQSCDEYYPVVCEGNVESYGTCKMGLIGCDPATNKCPAFFQNGATKTDDIVAGSVSLVLAVFILCICLVGLVAVLRKVLFSASKRIIYKATKMNGLLAILVGTGKCTVS